MSETRFSVDDVREVLEKSDLELVCTKRLMVKISIIRPSDNATESGLSRKFAVGLYCSPGEEMSHDYDFSLNRLLSLEELTELVRALGIELDAKVWQVTEDPNAEQGQPQVLSDLEGVRIVE